jgi:hypothetical protein
MHMSSEYPYTFLQKKNIGKPHKRWAGLQLNKKIHLKRKLNNERLSWNWLRTANCFIPTCRQH